MSTPHSPAMQSAIADLVLEQDAEPLDDEQTAYMVDMLADQYGLTDEERDALAVIATGPTGY
jgi:acetyl-CoA acetyltransferase